MKDGYPGAQSPRVNSELPNLTRQSTQRRAGVDPKRAFPVRSRYRRNARQERPFLKEASNTPARNIRRKQSNVANRRIALKNSA
jgi:hypothetical protein